MEHITINSNRSVTVPVELRKIGVQYDHNVNVLSFICPRYSGNVDLSTMSIYINYILSDKTPGKYKAKNVIVDELDDSLIHFDWTITRNVTQVSGVLSCLVCAKKTDEEGNEVNHWNTEIFRLLSVSEGMENDQVIQEQYPDVITSLFQKIEETDTKLLEFSGLSAIVSDLEDSVDELKGDLDNIATKKVASKNIFDGSQEMLIGEVITGADTTSANSNYDSTKNFIDIGAGNGGKKIYPYSNYTIRAVAEYDTDKSFIKVSNYIDIGGLTLDSNTRYVRVSIPKETEAVYMLSVGEFITEYEPYKTAMVASDDFDISSRYADMFENIGIGMNVLPPDIVMKRGVLNVDGSINTSYSAYKSTDFIAVKPSQSYTIYNYDSSRNACILSAFRAYIYYDKNHDYIDGWSAGTGLPCIITVPNNCYYLRVSLFADKLPNVFIAEGNSKQEEMPTYESENRLKPIFIGNEEYYKNEWFGKTIVGLGDSITQADGCEQGWIHRVANHLGMRCYNYGINGSTIAIKESDPTTRNPMVTRYESLPDADIVFVLAGSNDWFYAWTPIGTFDDRTNYTLYGALHNLIIGLIQKYENNKVVFATPIKRGDNANIVNANGKTLAEYCDIIKEVCAYYGIPCLDSNKFVQLCPFIEWQNTKYFLEASDGNGGMFHDYTHPNDLGHEKIANYFVGQLKSLYY